MGIRLTSNSQWQATYTSDPGGGAGVDTSMGSLMLTGS